ncbi:MAG TPA: TA system VapC family ribonuclease toxin [Vicinamibacteria bacterium]
MKVAVDTNVLVYAHVASLAEHAAVKTFLKSLLDRPDVTVVVTPGVLHELVHVITDPRRFDPPVAMAEALALARLYLGRANVECLATGADALADALALLEKHGLGRRRLADTLFAATLLRHGVRQLVTANPGDFAVFPGLQLVDPRRPASTVS